MRTAGVAKISVQNLFCDCCAEPIRKIIVEELKIESVVLFPSEALVVFNFTKANQVSEVLNLLTVLGHPPKGDRVDTNHVLPFCKCQSNLASYNLMVS